MKYLHKRTIEVDLTNVRSPTVPEVKRDNKGRWMKGHSGNPNGFKGKGKRAKLSQETIDLLAANTDEAIRNLLDLMDSPDQSVRLAATKYFIEKGLGRDFQAFEPVEDSVEDMTIRILRATKNNIIKDESEDKEL